MGGHISIFAWLARFPSPLNRKDGGNSVVVEPSRKTIHEPP